MQKRTSGEGARNNMIQSPVKLSFDIITPHDESEEPPSVSVLRVKTTYWKTKRGIHTRRDITTLKKLSSGYQILEEDSDSFGVDEVMQKIVNLHEVEDGLYEVTLVNKGYDWETGYLDDYDYELIPYKP